MKVVATIEARMSSTRLPGKVLMDLGGVRSLECQIGRLQKSRYIDEIVLATTINPGDDALEDFAKNSNIAFYRGSENDVMSRILEAVTLVNGELHVQTTGDCPLIDASIVDQVIEEFFKTDGQLDFVSNEIERSFPIGLDCRVFPVEVLKRADELCVDPMHRIHGSTYIYLGEGKKIFSSKNVSAPEILNKPECRWTLDELRDYEFIKRIIKHFKGRVEEFSAEELMEWLNTRPDVVAINADVRQKKIEDG